MKWKKRRELELINELTKAMQDAIIQTQKGG